MGAPMYVVSGRNKQKAKLSDVERSIARRQRPALRAPSLTELVLTLGVTIFMAPFVVVTFLVIPMMGQITVGFSVLVTALYLFYRRSVLVWVMAVGGSVIFWSALFLSIQGIKNQLAVPLFILTALGIPVCVIYSMLIGARIWAIRGGTAE